MSGVLTKFVAFSTKYPITRGMASYAIIWPLGSLIQQSLLDDKELDFVKAAKFGLYGSFFVAPTLYTWLTVAGAMFPQATLGSALAKAIIEQFSYTPFAMVCFYFGMTILQGGTKEEGAEEVKQKFLPTYQVGVSVWPVLQTINYTLIPEKNRVVFVSCCSLLWTTFLAYMKHLEGGIEHPIEETPLSTPSTLAPIVTTTVKRKSSDPIWPFQRSMH